MYKNKKYSIVIILLVAIAATAVKAELSSVAKCSNTGFNGFDFKVSPDSEGAFNKYDAWSQFWLCEPTSNAGEVNCAKLLYGGTLQGNASTDLFWRFQKEEFNDFIGDPSSAGWPYLQVSYYNQRSEESPLLEETFFYEPQWSQAGLCKNSNNPYRGLIFGSCYQPQESPRSFSMMLQLTQLQGATMPMKWTVANVDNSGDYQPVCSCTVEKPTTVNSSKYLKIDYKFPDKGDTNYPKVTVSCYDTPNGP